MLLPIPEDVLQAQARERVLDLLLGSLGFSAAVVSAGFATYMIATSSGGGLAGQGRVILARGLSVEHKAVRAIGVPPHLDAETAGDPTAAPPLDFTPTGTIPSTPEPGRVPPGAPAKTVLPDFAVRDVFDGTALVEANGTLQMVRPGSVIEGAGEVLSVTRKGNGWVVATAGGTILQRR